MAIYLNSLLHCSHGNVRTKPLCICEYVLNSNYGSVYEQPTEELEMRAGKWSHFVL